jgi:hypothetical protein
MSMMNTRFLFNVFLKGVLIFVLLNLLVVALPAELGKLSLYNVLLDGRVRFPFGETPEKSYNISLFDLDAMFASHVISGTRKGGDEFRVILIGDSATWGTLQRPEETIAGMLEASRLTTCSGQEVHFYNLGYPTVSLVKDLMVLDYARQYDPDLIIWPLTMESFPTDKQLASPIVANNAARVDDLTERYDLPLDPGDPELVRQNFWERTLIGQRRPLADLIRLQLYGVPWSATGVDQIYPSDYTRAQTDLSTDTSYHGQPGPVLDETQMAFPIFNAVLEAAGEIPIILVNEPILISAGENSELRYNFMYPRWAYDQWRVMMQEQAGSAGWTYIDLWNLVPAGEFTNSAIHITPAGVSLLVEQLKPIIEAQTCP